MEGRVAELRDEFTSYEYSYFNIPNKQKLILSIESIQNCNEDEVLDLEKFSFLTTRFLFKEDTDRALLLSEKFLDVYPRNIQGWINKGMGILLQPNPDLNLLESVYAKFVELKSEKFPQLQAKVYHTYWVWTYSDQGFDSFKRCINVFKTTLAECHGNDSLVEIEMRCSLFCVKNIYRLIRNQGFDGDADQECWIVTNNLIPNGFSLLSRLQSAREYYTLESWVWMSEFLQLSPRTKTLRSIINYCIDRYQETFTFEGNKIEFCVRKALKIFNSFEQKQDLDLGFDLNDFYGRLGKSYYFLATRSEMLNGRIQLLERAIGLAGKYIEIDASCPMFVPDLCVKVLLNLWAVKYFQKQTARAMQSYEQNNGWKAKDNKQIWNYLAYHYCDRNASPETELREILTQVKTHLCCKYEIVRDGFEYQLPRVMYIMGESKADVEKEVQKLLQLEEIPFNALQFCALYYEQTGRYKLSLDCCHKAMDIVRVGDYQTVVRRCMQRVRRLHRESVSQHHQNATVE